MSIVWCPLDAGVYIAWTMIVDLTKPEQCSVVDRVISDWLRFGTQLNLTFALHCLIALPRRPSLFCGKKRSMQAGQTMNEVLYDAFNSSGYITLLAYLGRPATLLAVVVPGALALAIVCFNSRRGHISERLQLIWLLTLSLSFCCARWEQTEDLQQLYIFSFFSVVCILLLFRRHSISPALAYALTFLSLWWVDIMQAFCRHLESGEPLDRFYIGVGGAGALDALFLIPLFTALAVGYAQTRLLRQGVVLKCI